MMQTIKREKVKLPLELALSPGVDKVAGWETADLPVQRLKPVGFGGASMLSVLHASVTHDPNLPWLMHARSWSRPSVASLLKRPGSRGHSTKSVLTDEKPAISHLNHGLRADPNELFERLKHRARHLKGERFARHLAARNPRTLWYAGLLAVGIVAYAFSPV